MAARVPVLMKMSGAVMSWLRPEAKATCRACGAVKGSVAFEQRDVVVLLGQAGANGVAHGRNDGVFASYGGSQVYPEVVVFNSFRGRYLDSGTNVVQALGGGDEAFGGGAAVVDARASQPVSLDERHAATGISEGRGQGLPAWPEPMMMASKAVAGMKTEKMMLPYIRFGLLCRRRAECKSESYGYQRLT
jgi:hypothetical protein